MECPAHDCTNEINLTTFACRRHWRMLSAGLKARVWRRWDTGSGDYDELVDAARVEWAGR